VCVVCRTDDDQNTLGSGHSGVQSWTVPSSQLVSLPPVQRPHQVGIDIQAMPGKRHTSLRTDPRLGYFRVWAFT
jgi:hypothetical protein